MLFTELEGLEVVGDLLVAREVQGDFGHLLGEEEVEVVFGELELLGVEGGEG